MSYSSPVLPDEWKTFGLVDRFKKLYDLAKQGSPERLEVVEWLASVRADRITAENQRRSTLVYEELYVRQHNMKSEEDKVSLTATVALKKGSFFMSNHFEDILANTEISAESSVSANPNPASAIAIYEWFLGVVQAVDAAEVPFSHVSSWLMPVVSPVSPQPDVEHHRFTITVLVPTSMKTKIEQEMVDADNVLLLRDQTLVATTKVSDVYVADITVAIT